MESRLGARKDDVHVIAMVVNLSEANMLDAVFRVAGA
jgi:hypothetical protein